MDARRRRGLAVAAGIFLAGASGCGTTGIGQYVRNGFKVGPDYGKPPAPVAADWIDADTPEARRTRMADGDWWSVFQDPVLSSLVDQAHERNPNLRMVGARVLEARAGQAIAVANLLPQSQQSISAYSRARLSPNMAPIDRIARNLDNPGVFPFSFSNWFNGFSASWELDLWGRYRRSIESSNASLDASVEDYDAALVTLFADVATAYVQYRIAQQRIQIARGNVTIQEGVLALAQQKFDVGTGTKLDVEQARTVLEQTRSMIPALEIVKGRANDTLCILTGEPPHDLEPRLGGGPDAEGSPMPMTPTWVAAGIPADLLRRRPDVRSAERQVAAQSARIGVAEADLYPTLAVNGTIGWAAEDFSAAFATKSMLGFIIPNVRWNILNYGRIQNNVRLQQAKTEEAVAAYQQQVLSAGREVQTSLRGFLRSQEEAEAVRRSVDAADAANRIGVEQYRTGTIDFNRVFNLETTRVQEQDRLAVARGEIALNLIGVYRALGGGWEYRLGRPEGPASTDGGPPLPVDAEAFRRPFEEAPEPPSASAPADDLPAAIP